MYRGDTADFDLVVTQNGSPVNLTGSTLRFTAKRRVTDGDADAIFSKSSASATEIEITDAVNGLATVHGLPADTAGLAGKTKLFYDVQVTDSLGRVYTLDYGTITVLVDVSLTTP